MARRVYQMFLFHSLIWSCASHPPSLTQESVSHNVKKTWPDIDSCYRQVYGSREVSGTLILVVHTDSQGQTHSVSVEESPFKKAFTSCVVTLAKKWVFPPPQSGGFALIRVPIRLHFESDRKP